MRPALLLGLLDDLSRQELLCLAGGGTDVDEDLGRLKLLYLAEGGVDVDVAGDLHCVDRSGQASRLVECSACGMKLIERGRVDRSYLYPQREDQIESGST